MWEDGSRSLREDKGELFHCAADAQKIANYTLAYHPDYPSARAIESRTAEQHVAGNSTPAFDKREVVKSVKLLHRL